MVQQSTFAKNMQPAAGKFFYSERQFSTKCINQFSTKEKKNRFCSSPQAKRILKTCVRCEKQLSISGQVKWPAAGENFSWHDQHSISWKGLFTLNARRIGQFFLLLRQFSTECINQCSTKEKKNRFCSSPQAKRILKTCVRCEKQLSISGQVKLPAAGEKFSLTWPALNLVKRAFGPECQRNWAFFYF